MHLKEALGLQTREMVALVGAGGKTTTLYRLAKELRDSEAKILVTTTTKIFQPTKPHVDRLFLVEAVEALLAAGETIEGPVVIGAGYRLDEEGKLLGLPLNWFDDLQKSGHFDHVLIEADGAASRLFKVPSEIEPVIPADCHLVVWIMAIKVLGKPLHPSAVHRAERAAALLDLPADTPLTSEHINQLVRHPSGCLKGIPTRSRKIALLNQADSPEEVDKARDLARDLIHLGLERAIITSYLTSDPVKDIVTP
jgi:molybdenum cofactor cytidylyltransferase